jgi:hypothetical protein
MNYVPAQERLLEVLALDTASSGGGLRVQDNSVRSGVRVADGSHEKYV